VEQGRLARKGLISRRWLSAPDESREMTAGELIYHMTGLTDVYNDLPEEE
jgi:hypothetical protein